MNPIITTGLVCSAALFMAMILSLAGGKNRLRRVSGLILAPATACGLFFYTYAYLGEAEGWTDIAAGVLRGVYTTCLMFAGRNDYASVARSVPWFGEYILPQTIFWLAHFCALFVSASAVLLSLGGKLLQTLRLFFSFSKSVYIIFGLHEQSLFLGKDIRRTSASDAKIIYISPELPPELNGQVISFGGIIIQEAYLENGRLNEKFMKRLFNRGVKRLCFLALDESESVNIDIAGAAAAWCEKEKIPPEAARILIRSHGELDYSQLEQFMVKDGSPVYSVDAFSEAELSARLLVRESPPYKTVRFDADGRAREDFCALVIGFGKVGQHSLCQIVMNGQFRGSNFKAVVVDREADNLAGQFERRYLGMLNAYDISFHTTDTRSREFYDLLDGLSPKLKYIVVALGTDDANYEATADLERYYARIGETEERPAILVNVCNKRFVALAHENIRFFDRKRLVYTADILLRSELDDLAEAVNFSYAEAFGETNSREAWNRLDYFSRESSRASADFIPAMLHIAGLTMEEAENAEIFNAKVPRGSKLFESLAITEHLRWNAFHYAMGYTRMSPGEMRRRAAQNFKRIQKDAVHLRHACLVEWDELDEVSALMTELSGKETNYKDMDRENVLQIPRTLSFRLKI